MDIHLWTLKIENCCIITIFHFLPFIKIGNNRYLTILKSFQAWNDHQSRDDSISGDQNLKIG